MFYIKTTKAGVLALAAAKRNLMITLMPSLEKGRTRVSGPQDQTLYQLARGLDALPTEGSRWPGDTPASSTPNVDSGLAP